MNARNNKQAWLRPAGAVALAATMAFGLTSCKSNPAAQAPIMNASAGPDPADANMAQVDPNAPTQVMGVSQQYTPQQQSESYAGGQQAPAPIVRGGSTNQAQYPQADYGTQPAYDQGYDNGAAQGEAVMEAEQAPPPLPEYDQPPAPDDNDIWTPGYWAYAPTGYYWVPGAWVAAPYYGALWTPGYWNSDGGRYRFHHGYWGRHIGFYGGINYGWGYFGTGYYGGYWNANRFYYNREASHVSPRIVTVYERPVVISNVRYTNISNNRISYNGGRGGVDARPRPYEVAAAREQHVGPLPEQRQFHQQAEQNRSNFFNENHGRPAQAAFTQPIATRGIAAPPERGSFGRPGEQPGANQQQRNSGPEQQRNQQFEQQRAMQQQQEQQHNTQLQQQHNQQQEQQRNAQVQQQRNLLEQQQHTAQANQLQQQRNLDVQHQREGDQRQGNPQFQQHNQVVQQQRNVQADQQRQAETQQRNLLQQQHQQQQFEQQRNQQAEQQRQTETQQRNLQVQQRNFQAEQQQQQQRNSQIPQQQQQQHPQFQPRADQQPRPEPQHVEQPHVQPQPQHVEQPHIEQHAAPAQPQHVEAPHIEQHAAPPAAAPHPSGGGGRPGGDEHPH